MQNESITNAFDPHALLAFTKTARKKKTTTTTAAEISTLPLHHHHYHKARAHRSKPSDNKQKAKTQLYERRTAYEHHRAEQKPSDL
jgi:hypothetical protein